MGRVRIVGHGYRFGSNAERKMMTDCCVVRRREEEEREKKRRSNLRG